MRFNKLYRKRGTILYETLSGLLKKMERDALILRQKYPQIPVKLENSPQIKAVRSIQS
ncbi:winged helix-turn-helix transcriptional regulator [Holdemania sp. 1001095H_141210_F2]|uniref:winged helix-turn-helix transcriptional regulator n=1 Tax=Holdemania sp. 1001095H_141210_F2 TaxID=2787149 RepID=UPI00351C5018